MSPPRVLDAYALLAFLTDEPGGDEVARLLRRAVETRTRLAMTTVNLGEVWYAIARTRSDEIADSLIQDIQGMAVEVVNVDWLLARQAAELKAAGGVAYADCFAAALARMRGASVITGDPEFKRLEPVVKVHWLGMSRRR
ncbi:MAG: type II toxin-antitoxin system VapC family toxin [Chloroflexota bacterium]